MMKNISFIRSFGLLLFLWSIIWLIQSKNINVAQENENICQEWKNFDEQDLWLFGEVPSGPFSSQLHAIYSFIPISLMLKSNLVIGELNVHEPGNKTSQGNIRSVHFSTFFDFKYFTTYWSKKKISAISKRVYARCFTGLDNDIDPMNVHGKETKGKHNVLQITRSPTFAKFHQKEMKGLLQSHNLSYPLPRHSLIKIVSPFQFFGIYSFWDNLYLLQNVHRSLRPTAAIKDTVKALLNLIPAKEFIALNIRVDDELFAPQGKALSSEDEAKEIKRVVGIIRSSSCLTDYWMDKNLGVMNPLLTPPVVYLTSNARPHSMDDKRRVRTFIEELAKAGIQRIFTRKFLYDHYMKKVSTSSSSQSSAVNSAAPGKKTKAFDLSQMKKFSYEHQSYIDMLMSRTSTCFIPSPTSALTSYLIQRFRKFDQNIYESFPEVNSTTYGITHQFREWGF
jgi:hypothetical protein